MLEIVLSVGIYVAVVVLLIKSVVAYCNSSRQDIVTEP